MKNRTDFAFALSTERSRSMRKLRFIAAQIIGTIKEELERPTVEIYRKQGLGTATFYTLRGKYSDMEVSNARRLRQIDDEEGRGSGEVRPGRVWR
jgi:putative transposase